MFPRARQAQVSIALQVPVSGATEDASERLLLSETCQSGYSHNSATAVVGLLLRVGRQCDGYLPSGYNRTRPGADLRRCDGSTAAIISERIYERTAPIRDVTPSPNRNSFLHEVATLAEGVCVEAGALLSCSGLPITVKHSSAAPQSNASRYHRRQQQSSARQAAPQ